MPDSIPETYDWNRDVDRLLHKGPLATGSNTRRSLDARAADVLNVKDYGAVGDGVTDDTAALQEAITVAVTNGLQLRIPAGTHLISSKLSASLTGSNTTGFGIIGDGRGRSILKYTGASSIGSLFEITTVSSWVLNCNLRGFKIDVTGAPAGTVGLRITDNVWRSHFDDLYITRDAETPRTGSGIYIGTDVTDGSSGSFDLKFSGLYINNFDSGFRGAGTTLSGNTVTDLTIADSYISSCNNNLLLDYALGVYVSGSQLENTLSNGALLNNCDTIVFMGGAIESTVSGATGINMDANTKSVIALCDFYNNSGGHFITNNKIGHMFKTGNSGFVYPSGAEIRIDSDGTDFSYLRFFENGIADVRMRVSDAGNKMSITNSSGTEQFTFDVANKRFLVQEGEILMPNATAQAGIYSFHGTPESAVTANPGSICLDTTGGAGNSFYVKESGSGNTGWIAK